MNALNAARIGFAEGYLDGDPARPTARTQNAPKGEEYGSIEARAMRYDLHWSMYRNNTYRNIRYSAQQYKGAYGLYRHTRGIYSPSRRIAEFARTYLLGGQLDHEAGDGKVADSAIPINSGDSTVRAAIARLWLESKWQIKKGVYTLWGPTLGDVFLQAVTDRERGQMRLEVVHPKTITYVEKDGRIVRIRRRTVQDRRGQRPRLETP
jgi:hypothetical protein